MTLRASFTNYVFFFEIIAQFSIPGEIITSLFISQSQTFEFGLSYPANLKEIKSGQGVNLFTIGKYELVILLIHPKFSTKKVEASTHIPPCSFNKNSLIISALICLKFQLTKPNNSVHFSQFYLLRCCGRLLKVTKLNCQPLIAE